jgi:hypothetical protein
MKNSTSTIGTGLLMAILLIGLAYFGFKAERWFHYKFGYQSQVQEELQPIQETLELLDKRIDANLQLIEILIKERESLEQRVTELENIELTD